MRPDQKLRKPSKMACQSVRRSAKAFAQLIFTKPVIGRRRKVAILADLGSGEQKVAKTVQDGEPFLYKQLRRSRFERDRGVNAKVS